MGSKSVDRSELSLVGLLDNLWAVMMAVLLVLMLVEMLGQYLVEM